MNLSVPQLEGLIEIFTELDAEKILKICVRKVSEILSAKGCSIFLYDEAHNNLVLSESTSEFEQPKRKITYNEGEGLTGWAFKFRKPLLIKDLDTMSEDDLKKMYGHEITWASKYVEGPSVVSKGYIAVPIIAKNKFIGIIRASSLDTNFSENDLDLLINIAGYIGKAILNGHLYLQEQKKADYFRLLTEFGTRLHSYYKIEDLYAFVAKEAAKAFSAETCEIYIRDKDNLDKLILSAGWGIPKDLLNNAIHNIGEGLTGTLVAENRIIRLNNVLTYPKYKGKYRNKMRANLKHGDRQAFLGIPISIKSYPIGCIKLYNKIPRYIGGQSTFTSDDETYLAILVDMLAVALENHEYRESMKNSALQIIKTQRLTALGTLAIRYPNEITNSLTTAQINVNNLLRRIKKNNFDKEMIAKKLEAIHTSLQDVATGARALQEFSTKAGFLKMKRHWQEIIDEGLLFLSQEIMHKKIKLNRDKQAEAAIPSVQIEPNEMIEVFINLFIIALSPVKHYEAELRIKTTYDSKTNVLSTWVSSRDNNDTPLLDKHEVPLVDDEIEMVTPHMFMLNISKEIIKSNYQGHINLMPHNSGIFIEMKIPFGGESE